MAVSAVIVTFLIVVVGRLTQSDPGLTDHFVLTGNGLLNEVTQVPAAALNAVGVTSPLVPLQPPTRLTGQPPFTVDGKVAVLYVGNEFSPFALAQKWPLIVALSRFGTFTNLGNITSSPTDYYPSLQGFTLWQVNYESPYVSLRAVEEYTNVRRADGTWLRLTTPSSTEEAVLRRYDTAAFNPSFGGDPAYNGLVPFTSFGNRFITAGSVLPPTALTGPTRDAIAASLPHPTTNDMARAIIAAANLDTAAICVMDGGRPGRVCTSPGVTAALHELAHS
jgi:Domain of unknown function (DUF929)